MPLARFCRRQRRHFDQRAAILERGGELQVLELDENLGARDLRDRARVVAWRPHDLAFQQLGGLANIFQSDGHFVLPGGRGANVTDRRGLFEC